MPLTAGGFAFRRGAVGVVCARRRAKMVALRRTPQDKHFA
jgi:hypothetical protein